MNLTKLISSVAIAGAIFGRDYLCGAPGLPSPILCRGGAAAAGTVFSGYPLVKLTSAELPIYNTNSSNTQKVPLKKFTYNTQTLINLLNASPNATNMMQTVTGKNKIPKGSYFSGSRRRARTVRHEQERIFLPVLRKPLL